MPVTPNQVIKSHDVARFDDRIDNLLRAPWSDYDRSIGRWLDLRAVGCSYDEAKEIVKRYAAVGWDARVHDSQRDGISLAFKPPGGSR